MRVLQTSIQTLSAEDVVSEVSSMLHADPLPFQQPSVEGRAAESVFGDPVAAHALHARVTGIPDGSVASGAPVALDVGSAGGFDAGTQFTAADAGPDGARTVIEVKSVDQPLVSRAEVVSGPPVHIGQLFELSKMVYPQAARLVIFVSKPGPVLAAAAIARIRAMFPELTWVDDPAVAPIKFLVVEEEKGWMAYDQNGHATPPGETAKGAAFLLLGPAQLLMDQIEQSPIFRGKAFRFTSELTSAPNYLLGMRFDSAGTPEYALFDPIILAQHKQGDFVISLEDDADDAALSVNRQPEVACRTDVSLPVRTAWLHGAAGASGSNLADALTRRIARLGKLRVWLQSPAIAPGLDPGGGGWPYRLTITQPNSDSPIAGPLRPNQHYDMKLITLPNQKDVTIPKYIYVFGFDCAANPYILYPRNGMTGEPLFPQPDQDGNYPKEQVLVHEQIGSPLGADTVFFMATAEKMTTPSLLVADGAITRGSGGSRFDELVTDMNDGATRGPKDVQTNWQVQQVVIPSRP